jgi:hypothetical protein
MTTKHLAGPIVAALVLSTAFVLPADTPLREGGWDIAHATIVAGSPVTAARIALVRGIAVRDDVSFLDGTLETDLDVPRTPQFAGVAFRLENTANYEIVYFRGDSGRWKEVQYQPVFDGEPTWQLYSGPGYNADLAPGVAPAEAPLHVKIAFAGRRADVYLNRSSEPVLRVPQLVRDPQSGRVAVWAGGGPTAQMTFADFVADARLDVPLAPSAARQPLPGQIMTWRVSARLPSPDTIAAPVVLSSEHQAALRAGHVTAAASDGLMNLSRIVGNPGGPQVVNVPGGTGWGLALASVTIRAKRAHVARMRFTFSEGMGVFLNGRRVFSGTNPYASPNLGRLVTDANVVELPLNPGVNELVLAVTDRAFGWGFRARLENEHDATVLASAARMSFSARHPKP